MIKILTNHPGQSVSPTWNKVSTFLPSRSKSLTSAIEVSFLLFCKQWNYDCVVLGAGRSDTIFALLNSFIPKRLRPICIKIDCLWYEKEKSYQRKLKIIFLKWIDRSIDKYIVWASREIDAYSYAFKLPKQKFRFLHYHTTLDKCSYEISDEGYLFSGGNYSRDYKTLIEAVRPLNINLLIGSTRPEIFHGINLPPNVTVKGFTHDEYIQKMASCKINIVPLETHHLHSGGQQTFLNSMFLGKPTIITDPEGAKDYVNDGIDGLLCSPNDPIALRSKIQYLLNDAKKARKIGDQAQLKAASLSTEAHFKKIIGIAEASLKIDT